STQARVVRAGEVEWSGRSGQEPLGRQGTKEQAERSQTGRVRNNQADKVLEEQAGEWSGIAGVGAGRVLSMSGRGIRKEGRKAGRFRHRGSWEQYTKAL
ncbi:unnamed protein product, partial [Staurois parvus]